MNMQFDPKFEVDPSWDLETAWRVRISFEKASEPPLELYRYKDIRIDSLRKHVATLDPGLSQFTYDTVIQTLSPLDAVTQAAIIGKKALGDGWWPTYTSVEKVVS